MSKGKTGSMAYQVAHVKIDNSKRSKTGKGNISSSAAIQYRNAAIKFGNWCKASQGVKSFVDCEPYIQDYADYLHENGKSASTIHTYLAGVCHYFNVSLDTIQKPQRICAENIRSRGTPEMDKRADAKRDASPRLWAFASAVGIRRGEYQRLRKDDIIEDETGHLCVRVTRGKGGKMQLQRILPGDEELVRSYFDGSSSSYVFTKAEMQNKFDLHSLRGREARRAYDYYVQRINSEGREKLIAEIKTRWTLYCDKKWDASLISAKPYRVRGANRALAEAHGLPIEYDRLALMATSIFHLAHWRIGVTVSNYILAVN